MRLFPRSTQRRDAHTAYAALVRLARAPELYTRCGIPDTLDGRFDAIVLHLFLLQRRLSELHEANFGRRVSEAFIADMDRSIREMGVGDAGIARRVKQMASALLGRMKAYETTWKNKPAFREALVRNLHRGGPSLPTQTDNLIVYLEKTAAQLEACNAATLRRGEFYATANSLAGGASSATVAA